MIVCNEGKEKTKQLIQHSWHKIVKKLIYITYFGNIFLFGLIAYNAVLSFLKIANNRSKDKIMEQYVWFGK